jgi:iron only hydrogenase large subunit-like protein
VEILGKTYDVAVTRGLGNARRLIEDVLSGAKNYHFIEIMACPGGCIGGGGQPILNEKSDRLQRLKERVKINESHRLWKYSSKNLSLLRLLS